ncbi:MAG: Gfo/Idh/MocA family oxidoreductase [Pseudomonadota bacterium]
MGKLGFGVIGTGFIAGKIASAIQASDQARVAAVSSRRLETAEAFAVEYEGADPVEGVDALVARDDIDAIFVATPTVVKEEIALKAVERGKHILVDKPFVDTASVERMAAATARNNLVFMDGTHFVHHPRTEKLGKSLPDQIGQPLSLYSAFYFPFEERDNIRFDPTQEPTGALGDLAWYCMRAVVEYLRPQGALKTVAAAGERDPNTGSLIHVTGVLSFAGGETSTFDAGYTVGTPIMDLSLLGTKGAMVMDDFVLDWTNSIAFQDPDLKTGYSYRAGLATRKDLAFVETPSAASQQTLMIDRFAHLVQDGGHEGRAAYVEASLQTQRLLDAIWETL